MKRKMLCAATALPLVLSIASLVLGCSAKRRVVLYTSVDQTFAEAILKEFEKETGIQVKALFDTEAGKTTGLAKRLLAERSHPRADVFWNNEFSWTIVLKKEGVLAPYRPASAAGIPPRFMDKDGEWTGVSARARVLIYNTNLVRESEKPASIFDLAEERFRNQLAMANPLFGTTRAHCAALELVLGEKEAEGLFRKICENGAVIVDGNAAVRDLVARGVVKIGITDTDDAWVAIERGEPVRMVFPDKESIGTLLIPTTVSLIRGGPNADAGKELIEYLVSAKVEGALASSPARHIPLRSDVPRAPEVGSIEEIRCYDVDFESVASGVEPLDSVLREIFLR